MRRHLMIALPFLASLALATGAQAVVVDMGAVGSGHAKVAFDNASRAKYFGVSLVPSTRVAPSTTSSVLTGAGVPFVFSGGTCRDPALSRDLVLANTGICFHGGSVLHGNETFALT